MIDLDTHIETNPPIFHLDKTNPFRYTTFESKLKLSNLKQIVVVSELSFVRGGYS